MKRYCRPRLVVLVAAIAMLGASARANEPSSGAQTAPWWTPPGETDTTAFSALFLVFLLLFAVFHFYARFDRYAERHNEGTPLKTTIPMLLMIAFAYEIFPPLSHFSILLPLSLIATALARDLMLWFEPMKEHTLKGELDGVLLEELQQEHLGEHDRYGRRVHGEPVDRPPSAASPSQQATIESSRNTPSVASETPSKEKTRAKQAAGTKEGSDSD